MERVVAVWLAVVALAALQLLLARWRDLGPATMIAAGMTATVFPEPATGAVIALAAVITAFAWMRSARAAVGQPELVAIAMAIAVCGPSVAPLLEEHVADVRFALAFAQASLGALIVTAALRRASSRRVRVRWVGEIAVSTPKP